MKVRKNKKGFTLIELLAVIVILGLLMAIVIPSVTKYITESRKKTLTTTLGNYIGALVNEVNDLSYTFTGTNTIYAVPIECIALERGGTNPFGHWYQANDSYFAYVLVQYDDTNSKYVYGFTFKDSAGYGLYPTIQPNIKEKGSQIKTGYTLNKPVTGDLTSLTSLAKWQESGFKVDSTTNFQVLEATSEGEIGDGINTCTLQQKGDNYAQVEEEKANSNENYAIYFDSDRSLIFVRSTTEIKVGDVYDGKTVTSVYTDFENANYNEDNLPPWSEDNFDYEEDTVLINKVIVKDNIQPLSTAYWFAFLSECSYLDVTNLDTSKVTNMINMFGGTGSQSTTFNLVGLENWDTSKVTNMSNMFGGTGFKSDTFKIDLSKWDVSNVTDMNSMFNNAGHYATTWSVGDLSNWNTGNVVDMSDLFLTTGRFASSWSVGDLSNWDTSNVTNMRGMLDSTGHFEKNWSVGDISKWDVSNVTDMSGLFNGAGYSSNNMILNISNWDTSKVTDMAYMFNNFGYDSNSVNLNISNWDVSNVTDMEAMFQMAGYNSAQFSVGDLSKWNTSNVTNMERMFNITGYKPSWSLDCGSWNVKKVTKYTEFNQGVTSKVKSPAFG